MASITVRQSAKVELVPCGACQSWVALTAKQLDELKSTHNTFYCPLGHPRAYNDKNYAELLKDEQRKVNEMKIRQDELLLLVSGQKREIADQARKLNRVEKGACPECKRHFVNVERHMANKHPQSESEK